MRQLLGADTNQPRQEVTLTPAARWGFFVALIQQCIVENLLRFSFGNAKLPATTAIFDLPAGTTCPGAMACLSKALLMPNGKRKIADGPHTIFRCYAASDEVQYQAVFNKRQRNLELILAAADIPQLVMDSIHAQFRYSTERMRWHQSGDSFSEKYALAICEVARQTPQIIHYLYTKCLHIWLPIIMDGLVPDNLFITASRGGKYDHLIEYSGAFPRNSRVVFTEGEAAELGLPIDHDDSHAYTGEPHSFCHLVHGTQPKGSVAGQALALRRKENQWTGYSKQRQIA